MNKTVSIAQFIRTIRQLQSDEPRVNSGKWYMTQKEHWLGWLSEYHQPGAYDRIPDKTRDAKFAYNHIVCPEMLLWLITASGIDPKIVAAAKHTITKLPTLPQKSAAIHKYIPWEVLAAALWKDSKVTIKR